MLLLTCAIGLAFAPALNQKFRSEENGFEFRYPDGWNNHARGDTQLFAASTPDGKTRFTIDVGLRNNVLRTEERMGDIIMDWASQVTRSHESARRVSYDDVTIDGRDAKQMIIEGETNGVKMHYRAISFAHQVRSGLIVFSTELSLAEKQTELFDAILKSWKWSN
jgi:hypothetical protein